MSERYMVKMRIYYLFPIFSFLLHFNMAVACKPFHSKLLCQDMIGGCAEVQAQGFCEAVAKTGVGLYWPLYWFWRYRLRQSLEEQDIGYRTSVIEFEKLMFTLWRANTITLAIVRRETWHAKSVRGPAVTARICIAFLNNAVWAQFDLAFDLLSKEDVLVPQTQ
ncbi:hypothetical protein RB195_003948 [Necator americanus]|uniref:Secreted protein n=1 Tax=Necator americanus TaxID=51031 RepID=A0ABR1DQZ0_NECAM